MAPVISQGQKMGYKLNRDRKGNPVVAYRCPHCRSDLQTALHEAGQTQKCPTCQTPHEVPGQAEYDAFVLAENDRREREENEQRLKLEEAAKARAEQAQREHEAKEQRRVERERQRARTAKRRASFWRSPWPAAAIAVSLAVVLLYFGFIRPLRIRADGLQARLNAAIEDQRAAMADLRLTVNHNADAAIDTARALSSLTTTVNQNADAANDTARALSSLTTTVNRNADAANGTARALGETSRALASLTATVNYNAEIANLNNLRR